MLSREEWEDSVKESVIVWDSIVKHDETCESCKKGQECLEMWLLRAKAALFDEKAANPGKFTGKADYDRYL